MTKRILITGGTGLVGTKLSNTLKHMGMEVRILTRNPNGIKGYYKWDIETGEIDISAFDNVDAVVHLAGAGVAEHRWTKQYKSIMESSRIDSAQLLKKSMEQAGVSPTHFISASASGYYGDRGAEILDENAGPGKDYLAGLCVKWEESAQEAGKLAEHTSIMRFGIVLSEKGGFVGRVAPLVRWYLGAALGSGNQYVPWVHIDDVVGPIVEIITEEIIPGTYNISAPEPITNTAIMKAIAKQAGSRIILPNAPSFALHILFGEMKFALLQSNRLSSQKLSDAGYKFRFTDPDKALSDVLGSTAE